MRPGERLRRTLARSDVRTTWIIGGGLLFAVSIAGTLFLSYAASESLDEADRWFAFVLQDVASDVDRRGSAELAVDDLHSRLPDYRAAVRVRDATGNLVLERGAWPVENRQVRFASRGHHILRDLKALWLLGRENFLVGEADVASGGRVELALPLAHFASEFSEIRRFFLIAGVIAAVVANLIGLAVAARAFAPLRRATALLRGVDAGSLGLRLPSRGTGDPIDVHAETLNRVLEQIDAAFVRLRAFSSDAAHELRTPLNRISNVTEVALRGGKEEELRDALERVHETTRQLSRLVQALLLLAEIDDRRFVLRVSPIDVASWIESNVDAYAAPFEEADVKLISRSEFVAIDGDRTLLDRILVNLLDNALAHAPAGSRVEIRAARQSDGVSISVDDAGPGIPARDRERVFDRFARLAGEAGPGHGLGLALARAIAELHGGSLGIADSPLGGARFELWLPASGADSRG